MNPPFDFQSRDALLIVDVQNDFCPGGALPVNDGDRIVPEINEWIAKAQRRGIPVMASRDWHPKHHPSFAEEGGDWPPHCIQDSDGARFHPDLSLPPDTLVVTKGVRLDKDQYSAFADTGLDVFCRSRDIARIFICGLALDVCVQASALDAVAAGLTTVLISTATLPVDPHSVPTVRDRLEQAGILLTDPDAFHRMGEAAGEPPAPEVCTKAPEWAEHQRLEDDDLGCDDGRAG